MSLLSFFLRFTLTYTLVLVIAGTILSLAGIEKASGINTAVLMGVGFWCFNSYYNKNERIPDSKESWQLIGTALAGDILGSSLLMIPTLIYSNLSLKILLFSYALIIPIHLLGFIFVSYITKKQYRKQLEQVNSNTPK